MVCVKATHRYVLNNYKDSWNDGPPWPECKHCRIPHDTNPPTLDVQAEASDVLFRQSTDPLSPVASEFYPSAYQSDHHITGHRLFNSLPIRHRKQRKQRRQLSSGSKHHAPLASQLGWWPNFHSATQHTITDQITEHGFINVDFIPGQIPTYPYFGSLQDLSRASLSSSPPRIERGRKMKRSSTYHDTERKHTSYQDRKQQTLRIPSLSQPLSPGVPMLRATSAGFVSLNQQIGPSTTMP